MIFDPPLDEGVLLRRYKRFFADVKFADVVETVHCANTGAMHGCSEPGSRVWCSSSTNPRRKLKRSLEFVETSCNELVVVNTLRANELVAEALQHCQIDQFSDQRTWTREIRIPNESGRFDFGSENLVMEVKMVSWLRDEVAVFPDAVSVRAKKHIEALRESVQRNERAVLFFCVPHTGATRVAIASDIDPEYSSAVQQAVANGVEIVAYRWNITPAEWTIDEELPFKFPG